MAVRVVRVRSKKALVLWGYIWAPDCWKLSYAISAMAKTPCMGNLIGLVKDLLLTGYSALYGKMGDSKSMGILFGGPERTGPGVWVHIRCC